MRNGLSRLIVDWVRANPGKRPSEVGAALKFDSSGGMLSYMARTCQIWMAGKRGWYRVYATEEEAQANHPRLCAEATAQRQHLKTVADRNYKLRRRAKRTAAGARVLNVGGSATANQPLGKGVALHPEVRITAPLPKPDKRYTPDEGAPGLFSSLGPGNYMPQETAISRAYPLTTP